MKAPEFLNVVFPLASLYLGKVSIKTTPPSLVRGAVSLDRDVGGLPLSRSSQFAGRKQLEGCLQSKYYQFPQEISSQTVLLELRALTP